MIYLAIPLAVFAVVVLVAHAGRRKHQASQKPRGYLGGIWP